MVSGVGLKCVCSAGTPAVSEIIFRHRNIAAIRFLLPDPAMRCRAQTALMTVSIAMRTVTADPLRGRMQMDLKTMTLTKSGCRLLAASSALFLLLCGVLPAQESTGQLSGTVTDASGAVVPDAVVTATSDRLPKGLSQNTDTQGRYLFTLPAGTYSITVTKTGFQKIVQRAVEVRLGAGIVLNLSLAVGTVSETVEVTESMVSLDTTSSSVQTNITASTFESLPRGRNYHSLLTMAPGVRFEPKSGNAGVGGFQVDGASGSENAFLIDGVDTSDVRRGSLRQQKSIPLEFIQELQIKSGGFGAEYGGATGGVVNVVTRGGANDFHGAFQVQFTSDELNPRPRGYWQRSPANANVADFFAPKADDWRSLYPGFELSGPILKDKLFFSSNYMPAFDSRVRTIKYASSAGGTRTYRRNDNQHYLLNRLDYSPLSKLQVYSSWVWSPLKQQGVLPDPDARVAPPSNDQSVLGGFQPSQVFTVGGTYTVSPRFILSARYGYNYQNDKIGNYGLPGDPFVTYQTATSQSATPVPAPYQGASGFRNVSSTLLTQKDITTRQNVYLDGSYIARLAGQQHIIKGGYFLSRLSNDVETNYTNGRFLVYWGDSFTRGSFQNVTGAYGYYSWDDGVRNLGNVNSRNQGFYVQDQWHVLKNLTLNIGVRFENEFLPPYKSEVNGRKVANPVSFGWGDKIAPRIGGSWDVLGDGKWKVAGSYGLYYDVLRYELARGSFGSDYWVTHVYKLDNPNIYSLGLANPGALGTKITQYDNRTLPINDAGEIEGIDPGIKPYKSREFSASLSRQVTSNLVATARYTRKDLLRAIEDIGVLDGEDEVYLTGNPGFGQTRDTSTAWGQKTPNGQQFLVPEAVRQYDGLEFRLDGRYMKNLNVMTSYTWSRLYGNYSGAANSDESGRSDPGVSRAYDLPYYYFDASGSQQNTLGRLGTDRPHTFKMFASYDLKTGAGNTFFGLNQIAFTGTPDTTTIIYLSAPTTPYGRGDLGRTPVLTQTDLSVSHTINLSDRTKIRLDAQAINIFNQAAVIARTTQINRTGAISSSVLPPDATGFFKGYDPKNFLSPTGNVPGTIAYNAIYGLPSGDYRNGGPGVVTPKGYNGPGAYQAPREIRLGFRFIF